VSALIALGYATQGLHKVRAIIVGRVKNISESVAFFDDGYHGLGGEKEVCLNNANRSFRNEDFANEHLVGERIEVGEVKAVGEHEM
jgi:hypothetical protein